MPLRLDNPPNVERSAYRKNGDFPDCYALYYAPDTTADPTGWEPVGFPYCADCAAIGRPMPYRVGPLPTGPIGAFSDAIVQFRPIVLEYHARSERCNGCGQELIPEPEPSARAIARATAGARAMAYCGNRWVRGECLTDAELQSEAAAARSARSARYRSAEPSDIELSGTVRAAVGPID